MSGVGELLAALLNIYGIIIFARALLSFFPNIDPYNPVVKFLFDITEPVLQPVRDVLRQQFSGAMPLDFSPVIVYFVIQILISIIRTIF